MHHFHSGDIEAWEAIWNFDLRNNVISIGGSELGDVSSMEEDELTRSLRATLPKYTAGAAKTAARMIRKFYHTIAVGDVVIARFGRNVIAGVGKVRRTGWHDSNLLREVFRQLGPEYEAYTYSNHIGVDWGDDMRDIEYEDQVFGMTTLYEISKEKFEELAGGDDAEVPSLRPGEETPSKTEIILEKYLEDFIVTNFDAVFQRKLLLFSDPEDGPIGQQFHADGAGTIDILAYDATTGDLVVIELKKGRPADKVVGQVLRYMGCLAENLCDENQSVRGMIICHDPDPKLTYALKPLNNVCVKYYRVEFSLLDEV